MGQIQSLEEFISLLLRRRMLILVVTLIGMAASVTYAKLRPHAYQAFAAIQIEAPSVGAGQGDSGSAQLLQAIEQRLTTRENLLAVIAQFNLFSDVPGLSEEKQVELLGSAISFQTVSRATDSGQSAGVSAVIISAKWGDADLSAKIANDFAQGILDQGSADQKARKDQSLAFYQGEVTRVGQQISALETEVANYKNSHADALPDAATQRQDEVNRLKADLQQDERQVAALTSEAAAVRQKSVQRETDRRRLADIDAELATLAAQTAEAQARLDTAQAALSQMPEVERVLSGYQRQIQQLQDQYTMLNQRLADAETNQKLAESQQGERFSMLERALTPEFPVGGNRKKIAMAGSVASLALALALAFLMDLIWPVVRTSAQMKRQIGIDPVICIPEIRAPKGRLGSAALKLIDDPHRPIFGMPRFAVLAAVATVLLLLTAAAIG